jgi:hypothetical protein
MNARISSIVFDAKERPIRATIRTKTWDSESGMA